MIFTSYIKRFRRDQNGATAVEAAFALPIVFLLIFACFEYGIFFQKASQVNRTFDEIARDVILLEDPSKAEIEGLIEDTYADFDEGVSYDVSVVQRYGEKMADIRVNFAYTVSVPFLDNYPMTTSYKNLVMLTTEFD